MSPLKTFAAAALAILSIPLAACAEEAPPLSPAAKQQMEQVVHEYLLKNPEVIIEAFDVYRKREQQAAIVRQRDAMKAMEQNLNKNPNDPMMGNPDGDVTVVEFFDYRCGYCKRVFDDIQTLIKEDGNIRYVLKEFPILGPNSVYASRAALAVWLHQKDKYVPFHTALMKSKGNLDEAKILNLAQQAGVDTAALRTQINAPLVDETLAATAEQATALNITGTPGFVIGGTVQPGAISLDTMKELVSAARKHP